MMEDEVINEPEVEKAEPEVTQQDRINDMIAAALKGDYVNANDQFNGILGDRVSDALDQEKIRIASSVYGDAELAPDDDSEDISDEEIEAELEDDESEESDTTETEEISDQEED
jgi:hypothetical protein